MSHFLLKSCHLRAQALILEMMLQVQTHLMIYLHMQGLELHVSVSICNIASTRVPLWTFGVYFIIKSCPVQESIEISFILLSLTSLYYVITFYLHFGNTGVSLQIIYQDLMVFWGQNNINICTQNVYFTLKAMQTQTYREMSILCCLISLKG